MLHTASDPEAALKLADLARAMQDLPEDQGAPTKLRTAVRAAFADDPAGALAAFTYGSAGWTPLPLDCPWPTDPALPWLDPLPKSLATALRKACQRPCLGGRW